MLFYWYFLLHFNYDIRQKKTSSDSTQSRDRQTDIEVYQQILPEAPAPDTEVLRPIRPQINFLWNRYINEIANILTFTCNITHIIQNFINLPVYASISHIFDPPKVQQDK